MQKQEFIGLLYNLTRRVIYGGGSPYPLVEVIENSVYMNKITCIF